MSLNVNLRTLHHQFCHHSRFVVLHHACPSFSTCLQPVNCTIVLKWATLLV